MRNVAPSTALTRSALQFLTLAAVLIAGGALCGILGFFLTRVPLYAPESASFQAYSLITGIMTCLGPIAAVIGGLIGIRAFFWGRNTDNDLARIVGNVLAQHLDARYTLIRNVNKWGTGYIDAVLVGPPGVLVFRILNRRGTFLNEIDRWVSMDKNGQWVPARINPTKEAVEDIKSLREFLAAHKLPDAPIFGVVVFLADDPAVRLTLKDPVVPATHLSSLYNRLQGNYFSKERIDSRTVQAIINQLYDV